jgi:transcription initiation factor TFIID TATA-box-binding protein
VDPEDARVSEEEVLDMTSKAVIRGPHLHVAGSRVVNAVSHFSLGPSVNIEKLSLQLERVIYEPEQFPGLIWRMQECGPTAMLFGSGAAVIASAKRHGEMCKTADRIAEVVSRLEPS